MLARVEWQFGRQPELVKREPLPESSPEGVISSLPKPSHIRGWLSAALLTLFAGLWWVYRIRYQPDWVVNLNPEMAELLPLGETAGGLTLLVLWMALLWQQHRWRLFSIHMVDVNQLYELSPAEFEEYVARLFRRKGFRVRERGRSGDRGVDLELIKPGGKRAIVQCKRYRSQIGPDIARELYGTLVHERAAHAFLVTTASISKATREWVKGKPMTLIDGDTLVEVAASLNRGTLAAEKRPARHSKITLRK